MKVGIIGLGFRLGYLGHVFSSLSPDFTIVGYVDPAPAGLATLQQHGIAAGQAYDTPEALLAAHQIDLLMIGSPNHLHLEHIRIGLAAGVKVFCEKPVVASMEQSYQLAELLAQYGQEQLLIGLVLRYAPMYRDVMQARQSGALGNIVSVEASEHIYPYHGAFFMRDWRRYSRYSGSFMLEKCCHDLDLYNSLIGSRPMRVASFGGRRNFVPENDPRQQGVDDMSLFHQKPSGWLGDDKVFDSDGDIVDHQVAIVEYANGVALNFHTNLNAPDQFRRFCIMGSRGQAEGDFIRGFLWVHDVMSGNKTVDKSYATRTALSQHYGADEQMAQEVMDHVLRGGPLPVSPQDAIEAGILALAMDEAREQRKLVDLAPVWEKLDRLLTAPQPA